MHETPIIQLSGPDMDTFRIYQKKNNTYRVVISKVVSPWPQSYSFRDIIEAKSKERRKGQIVCRDASESTEKFAIRFQMLLKYYPRQATH